jgi:hypothetical protein
MSRTKELKSLPENNINLFNIFSILVPERKSKYTETLLRIIKKTPGIEGHVKEVKSILKNELDIDVNHLDELHQMEILMFYRILDMFNRADLKSFIKFCEYNERGLIRQNDLSRYNDFDEIINSLNMAEIIVDHKELEKQVKVVFENDEWLLIRPLTYLSSKKYGSNTKWCTTSEGSSEHFMRYTKKGVLIYCLNKKSGYKVASFYSLDKNDPEFSFWDQKDRRVDSLETELTDELRTVIFNESRGKGAKTNRFLLSDEERVREEQLLKHYEYKSGSLAIDDRPVATEVAEPRVDYIRRAAERAAEEMETPTQEVVSENYFLTNTQTSIYSDEVSPEEPQINRA